MKLFNRMAALASTLALITSAGCAADTTSTTTATTSTATAAGAGKMNTLAGGTQYVDEKVGTGPEATPGKKVSVHYTGTLTDGKKFDSSRDRGQPFSFTLGGGQVIKGWDTGVAGMKVGGKRKLTIPADQAYGARSPSPDIPPNSVLLFDVELLGVQ